MIIGVVGMNGVLKLSLIKELNLMIYLISQNKK